jgi:putative DNA primase/helicase
MAANITPAAVFRSIDKYHPTLLCDEADTYFGNSPELRGIVNSGHTRGSAFVVRSVGDDHETAIFSTWCAKAIARIGGQADTLADRSITVKLRRRRPDEPVVQLREDRLEREGEPIRRQAARWVADNIDRLREHNADVPAQLDDRAADNWRPLLAIADVLGGEWPARAREAAVALSGVADDDRSSHGTRLLADIRELFGIRAIEALYSKTIIDHLHLMEGRPWVEWTKEGHPMSKNQLAVALEPFEVHPKKVREPGGDSLRGYALDDFADVFTRYLGAEHPPFVHGDALEEDAA